MAFNVNIALSVGPGKDLTRKTANDLIAVRDILSPNSQNVLQDNNTLTYIGPMRFNRLLISFVSPYEAMTGHFKTKAQKPLTPLKSDITFLRLPALTA
ncbi:MAG: hypothetical protein LBS60_04175 [Deltaproteobacteria bacterium]|jgi:hypothetical protein|nr:hypothetical protein [Deltaproteobacteria bacterium]